MTLSVRHHASLADFAPAAWDGLFAGRAEGWHYFRACETAAPEGFATSAMAAYDDGGLLAAAPLFATDYRLDMSLEGALKPVVAWLARHAPQLVIAPVLGLGSPLTEECPLGFRPGMTQDERAAALALLIAGMETHAAENAIPLLALKDTLRTATPPG